MKKCIILANGTPPPKEIFQYLQSVGYQSLICADGGANAAKRMNLIPGWIIGDQDSIMPRVYQFYMNKCKIIKISGQNDTDVEKCLKYACRNRFIEALLLGATGDRLDHSFCNIGIVLKFFNKIKIKIIHQKSILCAYTGKVILRTVPGETISIYGIDQKTKFESFGLLYPLKCTSLAFGIKESTSNVALGSEVILNIKYGRGLVVREFEKLRKYGLIQST